MTNSKSKGSRNERNVAKLMQEWTGYEFARTPQSGGLHWKKQHTSGDIVCIDEKHRFKFSIECKFHQDLEFHHLIDDTKGKKANKILEFWEQSVRDAKPFNKIPLVFMRKNGMPADMHFVIMEGKIFSHLLGELLSGRFTSKYGYIRFVNDDLNIIILNSRDLFSWDYRLVRKTLRRGGTL